MLMQQRISTALEQNFGPEFLNVENESYQHNVPANSETHFKVVIVSSRFTGKRLLQRHREVNSALVFEFQNGLHALALHTYTPEEWQQKQHPPASPKCLGGSNLG